eukprot:7905984-Pyramimonas_sp.AAC.1
MPSRHDPRQNATQDGPQEPGQDPRQDSIGGLSAAEKGGGLAPRAKATACPGAPFEDTQRVHLDSQRGTNQSPQRGE